MISSCRLLCRYVDIYYLLQRVLRIYVVFTHRGHWLLASCLPPPLGAGLLLLYVGHHNTLFCFLVALHNATYHIPPTAPSNDLRTLDNDVENADKNDINYIFERKCFPDHHLFNSSSVCGGKKGHVDCCRPELFGPLLNWASFANNVTECWRLVLRS